MQHEAGRIGQRVDARFDELLDGAGDLDAVGVADERPLAFGRDDDALVDERERDLLGERGVPVGSCCELAGELGRDAARKQRLQQLGDPLVRERRETQARDP